MRRSPDQSGFIAATIVAATIVFTASSALAKGGPESATVSGPGIGRPIELDTVSAGLVGRAMEQTGLWWAEAGDLPLPLEEPPDLRGPGYTLTWVRYGDPRESVDERTIRQVIYPFAEGGVVIHNPIQEGLRHSRSLIGWFELPQLRETLADLGIPAAGASSLREAAFPQVAAEPASARHPAGAVPYLAVLALVASSGHTFRWRRVRG